MTNSIYRKNNLVLGIALTSRGFGFAVLEDRLLVNWGVKTVGRDKNAETLNRVEKIIAHYKPGMLVLHNAAAKDSRRGPRIRTLTEKVVAMAASHKTKVKLFSRDQVMQAFFIDSKGTKHSIAKFLAMRFKNELGHRLPRKRKDWEGEDSRMSIFEAVALAVTQQMWKQKRL